jgi:Uma2 family endonuclease
VETGAVPGAAAASWARPVSDTGRLCLSHAGAPRDEIFTTPPFIAIEILSNEDRMSRVRQKINQYLDFGVSYVWVIDPQNRKAGVYTAQGIFEANDLVLRVDDPAIEISLVEIFAALGK